MPAHLTVPVSKCLSIQLIVLMFECSLLCIGILLNDFVRDPLLTIDRYHCARPISRFHYSIKKFQDVSLVGFIIIHDEINRGGQRACHARPPPSQPRTPA